jgi:hypothetical protein
MSLRTAAAAISLQRIVTHSIDFRHTDEEAFGNYGRPGRTHRQEITGRKSLGLKNGRPGRTRTSDLFRVKEAL